MIRVFWRAPSNTPTRRFRVLPYTTNHAFSLFDLPLLHEDLFDRQIIAQALSEEIPVMTCDEKFNLYKGLESHLVIIVP